MKKKTKRTKQTTKKKISTKTKPSKKYIYFFGKDNTEGNGTMKDILGSKGAQFAEMAIMGAPVPLGFTITTEVCTNYYKNKKKVPPGLNTQMMQYIKKLEKVEGKKFGDPVNPLLLSVRAGAKIPMPGLMNTILNLGINDITVKALIKKTNNPRFAWDSYRRFIQTYADGVLDVSRKEFEHLIDNRKRKTNIELDIDFTATDLKDIVAEFKAFILKKTGKDFPQDPIKQLKGARDAAYKSWMSERAVFYRKSNNIPESIGTAVNIQAMVFGNMGNDSGTGVVLTRNPITGEKAPFGEYLLNAQGEDVLYGLRTPNKITNLGKDLPGVYKQLMEITTMLETKYHDMQDFEFTIEVNKLYILQTRTAKRTAAAAVKIAVDMVKEKLITKEEAMHRATPDQIYALLLPIFDPKIEKKPIAKVLGTSAGCASGRVYFLYEDAQKWVKPGDPLILVTCDYFFLYREIQREIEYAAGVFAADGGMTSIESNISRDKKIPCVCGFYFFRSDIIYNDYGRPTSKPTKLKDRITGLEIKEGDWISIDGSGGKIYEGKIPLVDVKPEGNLAEFLNWLDEMLPSYKPAPGTLSEIIAAKLTAAQEIINKKSLIKKEF